MIIKLINITFSKIKSKYINSCIFSNLEVFSYSENFNTLNIKISYFNGLLFHIIKYDSTNDNKHCFITYDKNGYISSILDI